MSENGKLDITATPPKDSEDFHPVVHGDHEDGEGTIHAEPHLPLSEQGDVNPNPTPGKQYQQLKQENVQLKEENQALQERLHQAEAQIAALLASQKEQDQEKQQLQCSFQKKENLLQKLAEMHFEQVITLEKQLEEEKVLASYRMKDTDEKVSEAVKEAEEHQRKAVELSNSVLQLQEDISKCHEELSEKASQLTQLEMQLQETQSLLDQKNKLVSDLEKVQHAECKGQKCDHHTQQLESQMKEVRRELMDTVEHLQFQVDMRRHSQQRAKGLKAAMKNLTEELRDALRQLDQMRKEVEDKDRALELLQELVYNIVPPLEYMT